MLLYFQKVRACSLGLPPGLVKLSCYWCAIFIGTGIVSPKVMKQEKQGRPALCRSKRPTRSYAGTRRAAQRCSQGRSTAPQEIAPRAGPRRRCPPAARWQPGNPRCRTCRRPGVASEQSW